MTRTCNLCPRCKGCRVGHVHCRPCRCAALDAARVAAERARIRAAVEGLRMIADMPWPARCVEGDLVTEDPDAYETEDDELLPDDRRCLTGGSHRWADFRAAVLAIVDPEAER